MKDVPNVEGPLDPRKVPSQQGADNHSDAFRKLLKVDDTDESENRGSRRWTRQEEEEEEVEDSKPETPSGDFSNYLEEPEDKGSILDLQDEGSKQTYTVDDKDAPSPMKLFSKQKKDSQKTDNQDTLYTNSKHSSHESKEGKKAHEMVEKMKLAEEEALLKDSPLLAAIEKEKGELQKLAKGEKKQKTTEDKLVLPPEIEILKKLIYDGGKVEKIEQKDILLGPFMKQRIVETSTKPKKKIEKPPAFEEKPHKKKDREKEPLLEEEKLLVETPEAKTFKEAEKDSKEKEKTAVHETLTPITSPSPQVVHPSTGMGLPVYTKFPQEIFEMFTTLVNIIEIEKAKGVSTTTVTLKLPGSVFHGAKVELNHYETDPHRFYVQMSGSPEAKDLFDKHLSELEHAFITGNYTFSMRFKKPFLAEEFRARARRVSEADDKSGNKE